jgi:hypothetical protein
MTACALLSVSSLRWQLIPRWRRSAKTPGVSRSFTETGGGQESGGFPYGIIFEAQEHRIVVIACFHGRRNPTRWQLR